MPLSTQNVYQLQKAEGEDLLLYFVHLSMLKLPSRILQVYSAVSFKVYSRSHTPPLV